MPMPVAGGLFAASITWTEFVTQISHHGSGVVSAFPACRQSARKPTSLQFTRGATRLTPGTERPRNRLSKRGDWAGFETDS
jgi:hypothetical protein